MFSTRLYQGIAGLGGNGGNTMIFLCFYNYSVFGGWKITKISTNVSCDYFLAGSAME